MKKSVIAAIALVSLLCAGLISTSVFSQGFESDTERQQKFKNQEQAKHVARLNTTFWIYYDRLGCKYSTPKLYSSLDILNQSLYKAEIPTRVDIKSITNDKYGRMYFQIKIDDSLFAFMSTSDSYVWSSDTETPREDILRTACTLSFSPKEISDKLSLQKDVL